MIVDIQTRRLRTTEQLRAFVEGNEAVDFRPRNRDEAYGFVQETLKRFGYRRLGKRDKSVVLRFLMAATGISRQQMERLVRQWRETGAVRDRRGGGRGRPFARKYAAVDIRLLAEVDEAYEQMSGLATREVLRRQFEVFGDARFERLATISNGHVYNLRASTTYRAKRTAWSKTRPTTVAIGLRQAPEPEGRPGHVRVDTVHAWTSSTLATATASRACTSSTSSKPTACGRRSHSTSSSVPSSASPSASWCRCSRACCFLPVPHPRLSRRQRVAQRRAGSEYINHRVAALLDKLRVERFTKSRARHSNDNALAESKNANVIRRWFGHDHIPQRFAPEVSRFAQATLSPFLNFHRPCLFATEYRDANGKIRRKYLAADVMTPYARLRSLPGANRFLKPGIDFALLDAVAAAETDLEAARRVQAERRELFLRIGDGMVAARAAG